MNYAHLHLIVNHFPIIITVVGLSILVVGIITQNKTVQNTAYYLFAVSMLFTAASMATGDGAEDMVETLPDVSKEIIEIHESYADIMSIMVYILGCISILGLVMNYIENQKAKFVCYIAIFLSLVSLVLAWKVGVSGGEIRHTEIRSLSTNAIINHQGTQRHHHDDDHD